MAVFPPHGAMGMMTRAMMMTMMMKLNDMPVTSDQKLQKATSDFIVVVKMRLAFGAGREYLPTHLTWRIQRGKSGYGSPFQFGYRLWLPLERRNKRDVLGILDIY